MTDLANPVLAISWRGEVPECLHRGAIAVASAAGIAEAWGAVDRPILPRSACKMLQALAMVESGAAERAGLRSEHLALACGSHSGTPEHTELVGDWLSGLGLDESALLCGSHPPLDRDARAALRPRPPTALHHQCSGKHAGFLTLASDMGAADAYIEPGHPAQTAVLAAIEEVTEERVAATVTDGCSAPNHAVSLAALAQAMARFANPTSFSGARAGAAQALTRAMMAHPLLIGGAVQVGTRLTRAMAGHGVAKSGAAGVYTAILPALGLGVALKIDDGDQAAAEAVIAAVLVRLGALDPDAPVHGVVTNQPLINSRGTVCGALRPSL
ncbi:MAG: asparaginase [Pseudomonadota bacterium]